MAKLADALASGASGRKVVQVQVLFRALQRPHMRNVVLMLPQQPRGVNWLFPLP